MRRDKDNFFVQDKDEIADFVSFLDKIKGFIIIYLDNAENWSSTLFPHPRQMWPDIYADENKSKLKICLAPEKYTFPKGRGDLNLHRDRLS